MNLKYYINKIKSYAVVLILINNVIAPVLSIQLAQGNLNEINVRPPILLKNYINDYKVNENDKIKLKCPIDLILSQYDNGNNDDYKLFDYEFDNNNNNSISSTITINNNNLIIINWFDNNNDKIVSSLGQYKITHNNNYNKNGDHFLIENDIYLIIKNAYLNDSGVYRCEANNGYGTTSVNLTLNVLGILKF